MPAIDQSGRVVPRDRTYQIGRIISQIFHPTINGFVAFMLVGATTSEVPSVRSGLTWAAICIITIVVPPSLFFYIRLFSGAYSDDDVSRRSERTGLYITGLLTMIIGSSVLYWAGVPRVFLRLLAAASGLNLVCLLINLRWKISVHSASIATLAMLATLLVPTLGVGLWLVALAVGWARVRTGNHTPLQVLAGWTVAVATVLIAFRLGG